MDLSLESKIFRPETHRSKVIYRGPNSVCFWAEISVQSPAFPGPKSRPRVQRFQNAILNRHIQNIMAPESVDSKDLYHLNCTFIDLYMWMCCMF